MKMPSPNPKISVIVPVYNTEKYLRRCIDSIHAQTFTDFELLLIDDGSKDSSGAICDEYAAKDPRIRVFHKENGGVSSARNVGIKNAKGDYILFLDSDDWLLSETCKKLLLHAEQYDLDCVTFGLNQSSGTIWAPKYNQFYYSLDNFKHNFTYWLNTELLSSSVNKLYMKSKIVELFPDKMSYGEDLVFVLNYLNNCNRMSFITHTFYQHEVFNFSSLTHSFSATRFSDLEHILQSVVSFVDNTEVNDYRIFDKYVRDSIHMIRMCFKMKELPMTRKIEIVSRWVKKSYINKLHYSKYNITWKDRLLLFFTKKELYSCVNLIVNGKSYIIKHNNK